MAKTGKVGDNSELTARSILGIMPGAGRCAERSRVNVRGVWRSCGRGDATFR